MARNAADARFWDRIARKYAADPIKDMNGYTRTLDRARHYLRGTDTVLELGCGTGTTALKLAPHVSRIVATDLSGEMIAIAREKAAAEACVNAEFTVATPENTSWPDNSFDAVLAFNLWHLVADRTSALTHVLRVLKPGGLFVSKTPCLAEMNPLIRLALPVMQFVGKAPYVAVFSASALEREIEAAGFAIIERARHGSGRKDARIFIVARKADHADERGPYQARTAAA
jgi:ubiquinone/menaquinone biosynthesis C-methylase UbiE